MKTAKLVLGIISMVLALVVLFQSCAASFVTGVTGNTKDTSGGSGVIVAIFLIVAGIVGVAAKKSKGGAIAATIIYALAGIIAVSAGGIFQDLIVWGVVSFIFAVVFGISIFVQKYDTPAKAEASATKIDK